MADATATNVGADGALFDLLSWMSPAWPIGAFAHSGGLEWAVEQGYVTDRESTAQWLATLLDQGPLHNDAVVFVHAWRAARAGDAIRLGDIAELSAAAQTGFERRLESTAQGAAFRRIAIDSLGSSRPAEDFRSLLTPIPDGELTYPIVAAALFATQAIALPAALTAYLHGAIANLVSAAQRLVPLGQTDAQRVLRGLRSAILAAVDAACDLAADVDPFAAFAGATLMAELGCMAHETQYTRLFRT